MELSFDSLAQEISRKKGTFKKIVSNLEELLHFPHIHLETNSVFTPLTVDWLSESMKHLTKLGVPNIRFSLSILKPWDQAALEKLKKELTKLRKILVASYKKRGTIQILNFRQKQRKGIFSCAAAKKSLALTPEGEIWGCYLFPDYFKGKKESPEYKKYFLGDLTELIQDHQEIYPRILSNYSQLRQDNFQTPQMKCFLCRQVESCSVCPVNASLSGANLGKIPSFVCEIQKIKIQEKERFWEEIKKNY